MRKSRAIQKNLGRGIALFFWKVIDYNEI